jgi:hypothetical protein
MSCFTVNSVGFDKICVSVCHVLLVMQQIWATTLRTTSSNMSSFIVNKHMVVEQFCVIACHVLLAMQ